MAVGTAMLAVLRTDANVLNFTMATVIVSLLLGLLLFTAGMYGKVGTARAGRRSARPARPEQRAARVAIGSTMEVWRTSRSTIRCGRSTGCSPDWSALYLLVFGIVGVIQTAGDRSSTRTTPGCSACGPTWRSRSCRHRRRGASCSARVIGGNVDHWINLVAGVVFLVAGMVMMALMQTDANFLNFSMVDRASSRS